ncbi:helix-turn-helix transcriptional regulator [Halorutilales archaeon Cl-col2-1]
MDSLEFLTSSTIRQEILTQLDEKPHSTDDLSSAISNTKQGIRNNLDRLRQKGWIEKHDGRWRLTSVGGVHLDIFERCVSSCETVDRLRPFLRRIPQSSTEYLDIQRLKQVEVEKGEPELPGVLEEEFISILDDSDTYRGIVGTVTPMRLRNVYSRLSERSIRAEVVMSDDLVRTVREMRLDLLRKAAEHERCELRKHGDIPFNVAVFDSREVVLSVGNGYTEVMVRSEADSSVDWANSLIDDFEDEASRVTG